MLDHLRRSPVASSNRSGDRRKTGTSPYLLEAKWEAKPTPAADLHIFEGKLGEKAAWSRGLFVSYIGFSEDGLHAFGRGKRIICMSGEDFDAMFEKQLPIDEVLSRKARRFAETGNPYVRVRDLF